ncbi:hypothetical protein EJ110_NYTH48891 [Nymphaea thermarum]|nr:hypothetical protein EJ110_NYTH48891 [Nymphaea thermarum]
MNKVRLLKFGLIPWRILEQLEDYIPTICNILMHLLRIPLLSPSLQSLEHSYSSLLIAYCKRNQFKEAVVLITQMRKVGLLRGMSNEQILSDACGTATRAFGCAENSELAEHLAHEFGNEDSTHVLVLEINAAISFFCTAKMIEDAQKSFRKMKMRAMCHSNKRRKEIKNALERPTKRWKTKPERGIMQLKRQTLLFTLLSPASGLNEKPWRLRESKQTRSGIPSLRP